MYTKCMAQPLVDWSALRYPGEHFHENTLLYGYHDDCRSSTTPFGHAQVPVTKPNNSTEPAPGTRGNADNVPFIGQPRRG